MQYSSCCRCCCSVCNFRLACSLRLLFINSLFDQEVCCVNCLRCSRYCDNTISCARRECSFLWDLNIGTRNMLDFDKTSTTWTWSRVLHRFDFFSCDLTIVSRCSCDRVNASIFNSRREIKVHRFIFVAEGQRRVEQVYQYFHRDWREERERENRKMLNFCHFFTYGWVWLDSHQSKCIYNRFYANGAWLRMMTRSNDNTIVRKSSTWNSKWQFLKNYMKQFKFCGHKIIPAAILRWWLVN